MAKKLQNDFVLHATKAESDQSPLSKFN